MLVNPAVREIYLNDWPGVEKMPWCARYPAFISPDGAHFDDISGTRRSSAYKRLDDGRASACEHGQSALFYR
jgi:hypothetical protein